MTLAELEAKLVAKGKLVARIEEVAPVLDMKRSAAFAAAKRGEIPTVRLGRKLLVPIPALLRMLGAEPLNREGVMPLRVSEEVDGSSRKSKTPA